jgi:hypothetical protein
VIGVAEGAGREVREQRVVFDVGRGHDHRGRARGSPNTTLSRAGRAIQVQVLDHLDQGGGIDVLPAPVAIGDRAVQQGDATFGRSADHVQLQPFGGPLQIAGGGIDADQPLDPALLQQPGQQLALAAAQVGDRLGAAGAQGVDHGDHPLVVQAQRRLQRIFGRGLAGGGLDSLVTSLGRQTLQRIARQGSAVDQVALDDQVARGMALQPAFATLHQLGDLVLADPVVLVVVEHRDQHIEVVEQVAQPRGSGQSKRDITRSVGVDARDGIDVDGPAQGLEQRPNEHGAAAASRQRRDDDFQRDRLLGQFRPLARGSGHGGTQGPSHGDRQEGRRGVGAVVDVLVQQAVGATLAAHQRHGIDIQNQRRLAARLGHFRIEDVRLAERQLGLMGAAGVLVQQEAQVGRRLVGGRDGQIHGKLSRGERGGGPSGVAGEIFGRAKFVELARPTTGQFVDHQPGLDGGGDRTGHRQSREPAGHR